MSTPTRVTAILDALKEETVLQLYVPSLKRGVGFKPISTGQQKKTLKAAIDSPIFQTRFISAIYSILSENCVEDFKSLKLNVFDYNSLVLQYRKHMYGDELIVEDDGVQYRVDVNNVIEKINAVNLPAPVTVSENNIILHVAVPLFENTYLLEKEIREKSLTDEQILRSNIEISNALGDAFIGEISKYIVEITLNKPENNLGYANLNFTDKLKVVEALPSTLVKSSLGYISNITSLLTTALQSKGTLVSDGKTTKDITVTIDAALFPVE